MQQKLQPGLSHRVRPSAGPMINSAKSGTAQSMWHRRPEFRCLSTRATAVYSWQRHGRCGAIPPSAQRNFSCVCLLFLRLSSAWCCGAPPRLADRRDSGFRRNIR